MGNFAVSGSGGRFEARRAISRVPSRGLRTSSDPLVGSESAGPPTGALQGLRSRSRFLHAARIFSTIQPQHHGGERGWLGQSEYLRRRYRMTASSSFGPSLEAYDSTSAKSQSASFSVATSAPRIIPPWWSLTPPSAKLPETYSCPSIPVLDRVSFDDDRVQCEEACRNRSRRKERVHRWPGERPLHLNLPTRGRPGDSAQGHTAGARRLVDHGPGSPATLRRRNTARMLKAFGIVWCSPPATAAPHTSESPSKWTAGARWRSRYGTRPCRHWCASGP